MRTRQRRFALLTGLVLFLWFVATGAAANGVTEHRDPAGASAPKLQQWLLRGVDALAPNDVWAVGEHNGTAVIKHWDGTRWHGVTAPAGTKALYDVDAVSATDVWAVGLGSIIHWDGSHWATVYTKDLYFGAVAAIAADDVWVVGLDGGGRQSVKVHWDGTRWSDFGSGDSEIGYYGIDATSADDVWAVGSRSFGVESILEHWDGVEWETLQPIEGVALDDVAAVSATDAWFVGQNPHKALVLHWNGSTVSPVRVPTPNSRSRLLGVSASSATDIWAVGSSEVKGHRTRTLIEHWDGSAWTVVSSPGAGHHYASWLDVGAVSSDDAWVVGRRLEGNRSSYSMTANWDGSAWTRIS